MHAVYLRTSNNRPLCSERSRRLIMISCMIFSCDHMYGPRYQIYQYQIHTGISNKLVLYSSTVWHVVLFVILWKAFLVSSSHNEHESRQLLLLERKLEIPEAGDHYKYLWRDVPLAINSATMLPRQFSGGLKAPHTYDWSTACAGIVRTPAVMVPTGHHRSKQTANYQYSYVLPIDLLHCTSSYPKYQN